MIGNIIHKELSYFVYGICFKAHNELGRFQSEKIYGDYIESQLKECGVDYKRECALGIQFSGEKSRRNIPDFVIDNRIVLDLKAKSMITKEDYHQMKRYLHSSKMKLGLIVNFRSPHVYPKRIINSVNS